MAEQDETLTSTPLYLSQVPTSDGSIASSWLAEQPAPHSLFELHLNPANPNQAVLVPAPGADGALISSYQDVLAEVFQLSKAPGRDDQYVRLECPTLLEKRGDDWKVMQPGQVRFDTKPMAQHVSLFERPAPAASLPGAEATAVETKPGKLRTSEEADEPGPASSLRDASDAPHKGPAAQAAAEYQPAEAPGPSPVAPPDEPALPTSAGTLTGSDGDQPGTPTPVGELLIQWKQQGAEVAPLLEMRAYLDQFRDAGVAVGALTLERSADGKLTGCFGISYDPQSPKLGHLEATVQGLRQVGHGLTVVEQPGQSAARRQQAGFDDGYEPARSQQVREAFGVKQWDALSAQLAAVPKHALTVLEQAQQAAAAQRVQQVARQQATTTEQIVRDGKSLFDIETSGNPASAFLKNFYAHLNGGPKTRQSLEVDYEKTRQQLQARLIRQAGPTAALPAQKPAPSLAAPTVTAGATTAAQSGDVPRSASQLAPAALFQAHEVPQQVLASLGLKPEELERSGQLHKLLNGHKTDLLPLQAAGREGEEPVQFAGKMVLCREVDGSATLKLELPQQRLLIPEEIGGQPITAEQRARLETEGNAGLLRGLKDEQGREYNGYVAVDPAMNKVVVLPEAKVTLHETIAGVRLTAEQSQDLREGKAVALTNMASGNGGPPFDGTAQVNAAKACIELKPAAHELQQRQAPRPEQAVNAAQVVKPAASPAEATKGKARAPHR